MKKILLLILKILLILAALAIAALLVIGGTLLLKWPLWVGGFILLGLVGLLLAFLLFRKLWLRQKEERFVQEVVSQDEAYLKTLEESRQDKSREVQDRWKEAIETLKRSQLKRHGNPLYVLPWYLIVGESGSGKTTAIKNSRLSSPFAEMSSTSGISGTRNCDWWFFEQAIIIDTAGRYAIPVDEGPDREEWHKFIGQLVRFRKKEPLNGLIVTVPADKLLSASTDALQKDAREIRKRISELMGVLGARFPICLLVTKCDLIQGMMPFCDALPQGALNQAMGYVNHSFSTDVMKVCDSAFQSVGERLRDLRLLLLNRSGAKGAEPSLLLFPEEFERLKTGLGAFVHGAFSETAYRETPVLRGVFFSSGRQEGSPFSHFLNALGLIEERDVLPGTDRGFFLKDFFSTVLPRDRFRYTLTERAIRWRQLTRNLGLCAWVAVALAVCGLLTFSFVKNLQTIRNIDRPPILNKDIVHDLGELDTFQQGILKIEQQNRGWWIPRLGLTESIEAEAALKDAFCDRMEEDVLGPMDDATATEIAAFTAQTSDVTIGRYAMHLVRRINLIQMRLTGAELSQIQGGPLPAFTPVLANRGLEIAEGVHEAVNASINTLNAYRLAWQTRPPILEKKQAELKRVLEMLLTRKRDSLNWLIAYVADERDIPGVTMAEFWGPTHAEMKEPMIQGAFTLAGKERIDGYLAEIESALGNALLLKGQRNAFTDWYLREYIASYERFATAFPEGREKLTSRALWLPVIEQIGERKGPYFLLMNRMVAELNPFISDDGTVADDILAQAPWLEDIRSYQSVFDQAELLRKSQDDKSGKLAKAASQIMGKGAGLIARLDKIRKVLDQQVVEKAAKDLMAYQDGLKEISNLAPSRREAFKMGVQVYDEDPVTSQAPFYKTRTAVQQLLRGAGISNERVISILEGPLRDAWYFTRKETACQIQKRWIETVLYEVRGIGDRVKEIHQLLDPNGHAEQFFKSGDIKPFLTVSDQQYAEKADPLDLFDPFIQPGFFVFVNDGTRFVQSELGKTGESGDAAKKPEQPPEEIQNIKDIYRVTISGSPTTVNKGGQKVEAVFLELKCSSGIQTLSNFQYPVFENFEWSPKNCDDVRLKISIKDLDQPLTRAYSGPRGFPKFLIDFGKGSKTFKREAFPEAQSRLRDMGIDFIKINFGFEGAHSVIDLYAAEQGVERDKKRAESDDKARQAQRIKDIPDLPQTIVDRCWDE